MAHGTPDWGVTAGRVTVYQLTDLAELAARLGSPVTFDRRGDVILIEDFEDGVSKLNVSSPGTGGRVQTSALRARNGRYSCHLVCGSAVATRAAVNVHLPFAVLSHFGFEVSFAKETIIDSWEVLVQVRDGTNLTNYHITWTEATTTLAYTNAAGLAVTIATNVDFTDFDRIFHTLKLVVDGPNGEYERLILNNRSFSLANVGAQVSASATLPQLVFEFAAVGRAAVNDEMYVGHLIVTQNQPA